MMNIVLLLFYLLFGVSLFVLICGSFYMVGHKYGYHKGLQHGRIAGRLEQDYEKKS
jgi:hypothetical protein